MGKIRVACLVPGPDDPTSYYRAMGPLSELHKTNPDIVLQFPQAINWSTLRMCDVLFMQRPALPDHLNTLFLAKELGKKVWIDFDDDNLSVPKDNPMYPTYCQTGVKDSIVKITRHADVVSVSTEFLLEKYGIYNKNTVLIPNALDDQLLNVRKAFWPTERQPRHRRLLWRGTQSQYFNLKSLQKALIEFAQAHTDWKYTFMGIDPFEITDQIKTSEVQGFIQIPGYFRALLELHPQALYIGIAKNDHAQARSHVAWLEATYADSLTIAPNTKEFTRPGILNYSNESEFKDCLLQAITNEVDIDKSVDASWVHIQEKYLLSKVNPMRMEILQQCMSM